MIYGYARSVQDPVDTTLPEPVDKIFSDISSDAHIGAQLRELINTIRPGDVILTRSPDRFGYSKSLVRELLDLIHSKGATVRFTDDGKLSDEFVEMSNNLKRED